MADSKDTKADKAPKTEETPAETVSSGQRKPATEAETARVRKAWEAGERIPAGFFCAFVQQGGQTVLKVTKKA